MKSLWTATFILFLCSATFAIDGPAILISPVNPSIEVGATLTLSATRVINNNGQLEILDIAGNVSWSSSNPGVATVDNDGTVTGVAAGTAVITAVPRVHERDGETCIEFLPLCR